MFVRTGSTLVPCAEHQLNCDSPTLNNALRVFTFHHVMYTDFHNYGTIFKN